VLAEKDVVGNQGASHLGWSVRWDREDNLVAFPFQFVAVLLPLVSCHVDRVSFLNSDHNNVHMTVTAVHSWMFILVSIL